MVRADHDRAALPSRPPLCLPRREARAPRRRGARSNKTLLAVLMMSPSPRARQDNPTGPSIMWHESSQKLEPLLDEFGCWRVRFRCSIPHFSRALSNSRVCAARASLATYCSRSPRRCWMARRQVSARSSSSPASSHRARTARRPRSNATALITRRPFLAGCWERGRRDFGAGVSASSL